MQDAKVCFLPNPSQKDTLVAIVCDGAGSAELGGQGASLVCRSIKKSALRHFLLHANLPADSVIENWIDEARDHIFSVATRRGKTPRDFASTLVLAISDGRELVVAHIGDGCVVVKNRETGSWCAPTWPDHGEYASTTYFVTDDPVAQLRITRHSIEINSLVLFSDGLERLALDFSSKTPFDRFFEGVCRPLFESSSVGQNKKLSEQLKAFLQSPAVNSRTDDDKTLILAVKP